MSDESNVDATGAVFAAGAAHERSEQAEAAASGAQATAETAVAVAEAGTAAAVQEATEARQQAAEATDAAYDARAGVESLRADIDSRFGELAELLRERQAPDSGAPTPPRRVEAAPPAQTGGEGQDDGMKTKTKKRGRKDGFSATWFGHDPEDD